MHISIDTTEPLSDTDKQILSVLSGGAVAPAPAPVEKAAAPAKKAAAPKATPKAEEPAEDDTAGDDSGDGGATLEEAVALATKMVSNGEAAKVKAALGEVGAKKVSEIPEDKVDEFIAALS